MGSAILTGLLRNHISRPNQIFVFDSIKSKMKSVSKKLRIRSTKSNLDLVRRAKIILLAIKPQDFISVAREIRPALGSGQTVISILAGTPISKLKRFLGNRAAIVRAMPNLGAQVGEGIAVVTSLDRNALGLAETVFAGCGKVIRLPEKHFDLVTAVSGSGPAYFFLVMELLAQIAQKGGIPRKEAELLAVQTALGAGKLAQTSSYSPEALRKMVTSKKGTTEAALKFLSQNNFHSIFSEAVYRAMYRAGELSKM